MVWAVSVIPFEKLTEISYTKNNKANSPNLKGNLNYSAFFFFVCVYFNGDTATTKKPMKHQYSNF